MPTTGAAERDAQIRLPLAHERGHEQREKLVEVDEEVLRFDLLQYVVAHWVVEPGERAQIVDPMRVRQEATVEHHVDVERKTVLVAERDDADLQSGVDRVCGEQLDDP